MADFGFSSQILSVGGLSGSPFSVNYIAEVSIAAGNRPAGSKFNIRLNVIHITNAYMVVDNSFSTIYNSLFEQSDVTESITAFKNNAENNELHMSNRRYFGGSLVSSLAKARNMVPKIFDKAKSITGTAANIIGTANNVVKQVDGKVDHMKNFFRY